MKPQHTADVRALLLIVWAPVKPKRNQRWWSPFHGEAVRVSLARVFHLYLISK